MTVAAIGDLHLVASGLHDQRAAMCLDDVQRMIGSNRLDAIVQLGDQTSNASTAEFNKYLSWRSTFSLSGVAWGEVPGNHDLIGNNASGTPDLRTPAQWATLMGQPSKDRVIDLPGYRLLLVSPAANATTGQAKVRRLTVDVDTAAWIADQCSETSRRVLIFFHAPLYATVGPLNGSAFSSYDERWHAHADQAMPLESVLASCPNVIAWVSGHTHSRVTEVDVACQRTYGPTVLAAVNATSPAFSNPGGGPGVDQVTSCLVTAYRDRVEVRYRDHGTHQWLHPVHVIPVGGP